MFKLPMPRRARAGFTMIELLTVIGIIIILMGILIPVVSSVRRKMYEADTQHELANIATACNNYFNDFHFFPGPIPDAAIHGYNYGHGQSAVESISRRYDNSESANRIERNTDRYHLQPEHGVGTAGRFVAIPAARLERAARAT